MTTLAELVEQHRQGQAMSGQQPIASWETYGDDRTYLQMLAASNPDLAAQWSSQIGGGELPALMSEAKEAGYYDNPHSPGLLGRALSPVAAAGRTFEENPALFFGLPFAVAGLTGAFAAQGGAAAAGTEAAAGGAAAGGDLGAAISAGMGPQATLAGPAAAAGGGAVAAGSGGAGAATAATGAGAGVLDSSGAAIPGTVLPPKIPSVSPPVTVDPNVTDTLSFFERVGTFLRNNQDIIGSVLAGWGETKQQKDLLKEQQELIAANYRGTDPGRSYRSLAPNRSAPRASERFAPPAPVSVGLSFDPTSGKMVRELMPARGA